MTTGIAKFEKVSFEQYKQGCEKLGRELLGQELLRFTNDDYIHKAYDNIRLPQRATSCSAGYDFFIPFDIEIPPHGGFGSTNELDQSVRKVLDIAAKIMSKTATEPTYSTTNRTTTER